MTHILVTGVSGLLGLNFALHNYRKHKITGVVHHNLLEAAPFDVIMADLSEVGTAAKLLERVRPDLVLNCAALANIDLCEEQPELAQKLNVDLPDELARETAARGVGLVHISTDAVFDGMHGDYTEEDRPNPLSTYARTKLAAEEAVLQANPEALVARVNFFGWSISGRRSLAEFFFNNLTAGMSIKGFTDVFFCPLEVTLLAELLLELADKHRSGIYHVVSGECLTKYDFGCRIAQLFSLDTRLIRPVTVNEGGLTAARSPNLRLRTEKLAAALDKPAPGQDSGLARFFEQFQRGYPRYIRTFAGQPG